MRIGALLSGNLGFTRLGILGRSNWRNPIRISGMDYLQQLYIRATGGECREYGSSAEASEVVPRKVVAFGNVLLDYTAHMNDTQVLERYKLSMNTRGELDVETLSKVTAEVTGGRQDPHLGGSALNTVRILKRLGIEPVFFGAVGNDKYARVVEDLLKKDGMNPSDYRLEKVADAATGRCICLVHKDSLALYANIGASSNFSIKYLEQVQQADNSYFLRNAGRKQVFYIEGFFVPQREEVVKYVVRSYIRGRRRLAINLSADYIVRTNYHHILYMAHHAYFIFGNMDEFEALRECWGAKTVEELAEELIQKNKTVKIVVITRGAKGVTVISNYRDELAPPCEIQFENYNVPKVPNVVDTTGCGDAFVAAFLHAWLEKRSLSECVRLASDVSAKVAMQIGCNLP